MDFTHWVQELLINIVTGIYSRMMKYEFELSESYQQYVCDIQGTDLQTYLNITHANNCVQSL